MTEYVCDSCLREDAQKEGSVYCYDCLETLCEECERYHKKNKASLNHKLIDTTRKAVELNTSDSEDTQDSEDYGYFIEHQDTNKCIVTDFDYFKEHLKCQSHRQKVKFLCKTHDEFCCDKCAKTEHRKCRLVDEAELNAEIRLPLENMEDKVDKLIEHESYYRTKLEAEEEEGRRSLENLKAHMDNSYEKVKNRILSDTLERRDLSKTSLLHTVSVKKLKAKIKCSTEAIENATIRHKIPVFLLFRKVQKELRNYEENLTQYTEESSSVIVSVATRASVQDILGEVDQFVHIKDIDLTPTFSEIVLPHAPANKDTVVEKASVQDIYRRVDTSVRITGVDVEPALSEMLSPHTPANKDIGDRKAVLEKRIFLKEKKYSPRYCLWINNHIIISFQEERALKLFNATTGALLSTYQCNSQPWAMTRLDISNLAVAYPYGQAISIMTVFKRYLKNVGAPIRTSLEPWALSYNKNDKTLLVASRESGFVQKYDIDGKYVGTVQLEGGCDGIYNITYDVISGYLYISYHMSNKVVCVDMTGAEIFQYSPPNISRPWSLVPDKDDNICITYYSGNCIQQVNKKGCLLNEIVPADGENIVHPLGMCFNERRNRFALLCANMGYIQIFKL